MVGPASSQSERRDRCRELSFLWVGKSPTVREGVDDRGVLSPMKDYHMNTREPVASNVQSIFNEKKANRSVKDRFATGNNGGYVPGCRLMVTSSDGVVPRDPRYSILELTRKWMLAVWQVLRSMHEEREVPSSIPA
jgi:hypothetical protein